MWVFGYTKTKQIKTHINLAKPYSLSKNLTINGVKEHLSNIFKYDNIILICYESRGARSN